MTGDVFEKKFFDFTDRLKEKPKPCLNERERILSSVSSGVVGPTSMSVPGTYLGVALDLP